MGRMGKWVLALGFGLLSGIPAWAAQTEACGRACLTSVLDTYLSALTAHDPSKVPVAAQYRATEDAIEVRLGDGLWKTITGLGAYRINMADPVSGNVGYIGEVLEGEAKVTIAVRLLVRDRKIAEIETILGRGRVPGTSIMPKPRASLAQIVPPKARISRAQMIETANANFDAILRADGSIYADDCQRIENRMAMSGNPDLDYPVGTVPGKPKPHFGSMGCRAQIEAHLFDQLDEIEPRRFVLVDEEQQLVLGIYIMRWYRKGRCNEIPNYGRICPEQPRKPVALLNAELLGVRDGRIHEIEAVFKFAEYASDSGWTGDLRGSESSSYATHCDRACLYGHLDTYLAALAQNDSGSIRTTRGVRYTENGTELKLGEGLWRTVTGHTSYEARVADPKTGQVAVLGELKEGEKTVGFSTRLKVENGLLAEVETVVGRSFTPNHPSMPTTIRPGLRTIVPENQRLSRDDMVATADRNFDNLLRNDGSHFAADCQRIENRMPMSGNPQLNYPITPIPGKPLPLFGSMGCQQQVESHLFDTLDRVEPRRFLIDEEQQVVFGVLSLRFYGRTDCNDIPGYGKTCPVRRSDPMSLLSAEMLGVRGGKVHEVEVIFTRMPYDAAQGWK
ncbi:MAG: hypothetical protein ABI645_11595 [Pseudomonadota bacterium]